MNAHQPVLQIVPITQEHIESYHRCLDAVARERLYIGLVQAPPLERTRDFVLANINQHGLQFVALVDAEVVGWCDILPNRLEGFQHCGGLGMGVSAAYRGQRIGQALITHTLQAAKAYGLERVELEVFAANTAAQNLYAKLGFVVEGVKRKARKIDGRYDDLVDMVLFL
jgi:RimJ/RimL family protein N-acetyltransferase